MWKQALTPEPSWVKLMTRTDTGTSSGAAPSSARQDEGSAARVQMQAIMGEQLDFLIEHAESGCSGCSLCRRYGRVRGLLLKIFRD